MCVSFGARQDAAKWFRPTTTVPTVCSGCVSLPSDPRFSLNATAAAITIWARSVAAAYRAPHIPRRLDAATDAQNSVALEGKRGERYPIGLRDSVVVEKGND
jgi:hypothetical protein